jgi:hypothetical protein
MDPARFRLLPQLFPVCINTSRTDEDFDFTAAGCCSLRVAEYLLVTPGTETMVPTNRWKEVMQSLMAIGFLLAIFWLCRPGIFTRGNSAKEGLLGILGAGDGDSYLDDHDSHDDSDESEGDGQYEEILAMPTCHDLGHSIERLRDARNRLLDATVNQDTQVVLTTAAEYREAVHEVRAGFATLKKRVAPDDFAYASQELLDVVNDGQSLLPCELGSLEGDLYPEEDIYQ